MRRDLALSDVVGTLVLLAVTVTAVGVAAFSLTPRDSTLHNPQKIDILTAAEPGDGSLFLTHGGGASYDRGGVRAVVVVNGDIAADAPIGASGTQWRIGESISVALPADLKPGDRVEVTVVSVKDGVVIATAVVDLPGTSTGWGPWGAAFNVTARFENKLPLITVRPPTSVWVEASVTHPVGRKAVSRVLADASSFGGSPRTILYDDGTHGDAVVGDGVFTGYVAVSANASLMKHPLRVTAIDVGGVEAIGLAHVYVSDLVPTYNRTLIEGFSHRLIKYPGASSGDAVTIHVKVNLREEPMRLDDGSLWILTRAYLDYDPFKPGPRRVELKDASMGTAVGYYCTNAGDHVKAFKAVNATIADYVSNRDTFRYFFTLEWKLSGGGLTYTETVDSTELDQYFLLRRTDPHRVVYDNGWTDGFSNCSL